jgi:hypothetical protein
VHDGIVFEKRGIPAAPIATEPFTNMGQASAEAQGLPGYPFAIVKHPIGRVADADLRRRAEEALPQVIELLTNRQ